MTRTRTVERGFHTAEVSGDPLFEDIRRVEVNPICFAFVGSNHTPVTGKAAGAVPFAEQIF